MPHTGINLSIFSLIHLEFRDRDDRQNNATIHVFLAGMNRFARRSTFSAISLRGLSSTCLVHIRTNEQTHILRHAIRRIAPFCFPSRPSARSCWTVSNSPFRLPKNSTCARMKSSQVTPPCAIRAIFHELLKPAESPLPLIMAPTRNSIRYIENDPEQRREKYDGSRWRLACTWNRTECNNLAYAYQLCSKHNDIRRNKLPRPKMKPTPYPLPMPIDDDIQIIREYNCVRVSCRSSPSVSSGLFPITSRNRG